MKENMENLNIKQFEPLAQELEKEKYILNKSADELFQQYLKGLSKILVKENKIIGHLSLWKYPDSEIYEVGTAWVEKKFRGQGVITNMFIELLDEHQGKNIFAVTTNIKMVKILMEKVKMDLIYKDSLSQEVEKTLCFCGPDVTCDFENQGICKIAHKPGVVREGECYIFTNKKK